MLLGIWLLASYFALVSAFTPIVRREAHHSIESNTALDIDVHGELIQGDEDVRQHTMSKGGIYPNRDGYEPPEEFCNDDFIMGKNNSNDCLNPYYHRKILDAGVCRKAADLTGARVEENLFIIDTTFYDHHPQGCFVWPCGVEYNPQGIAAAWGGSNDHNSNTTMCYYYNGNAEVPLGRPNVGIQGPPICYRAEYLNGTWETQPNCDPGYENIMDEEVCRETATCLGFAIEEEFRVGEWNWSKHEEYPRGCFIRNDTGAIQFNNISSLPESRQYPIRPHVGGGTPVCNVSTILSWDPDIVITGDHRAGWGSIAAYGSAPAPSGVA